jgi:hypothetical protein
MMEGPLLPELPYPPPLGVIKHHRTNINAVKKILGIFLCVPKQPFLAGKYNDTNYIYYISI